MSQSPNIEGEDFIDFSDDDSHPVDPTINEGTVDDATAEIDEVGLNDAEAVEYGAANDAVNQAPAAANDDVDITGDEETLEAAAGEEANPSVVQIDDDDIEVIFEAKAPTPKAVPVNITDVVKREVERQLAPMKEQIAALQQQLLQQQGRANFIEVAVAAQPNSAFMSGLLAPLLTTNPMVGLLQNSPGIMAPPTVADASDVQPPPTDNMGSDGINAPGPSNRSDILEDSEIVAAEDSTNPDIIDIIHSEDLDKDGDVEPSAKRLKED